MSAICLTLKGSPGVPGRVPERGVGGTPRPRSNRRTRARHERPITLENRGEGGIAEVPLVGTWDRTHLDRCAPENQRSYVSTRILGPRGREVTRGARVN